MAILLAAVVLVFAVILAAEVAALSAGAAAFLTQLYAALILCVEYKIIDIICHGPDPTA